MSGREPGDRAAAVPTAAELEAAVRRLPFPAAIVATQRDPADREWVRGGDRDIMHVRWLIARPDAAERLRNAHRVVDFGAIVDVERVGLSDPARMLDQHTKRVGCIALLNGRLGRRRASSTFVYNFGLEFDWFLRWRLSVGLHRTADITNEHFTDFLDRTSRRSAVDLIPFEERVAALAARAMDPAADAKLRSLNLADIAAELGVTYLALLQTQWVKPVLRKSLGPCMAPGSDAEGDPGKSQEEPSKRRSAQSVVRSLDCWSSLSRLSALGALSHDPMNIDPFVARSPQSLACQHGDGTGRRGAMPPTAMLRLLDAAARWQLDWGSAILDAAERMRAERSSSRSYYYGRPDELLIEESVAYAECLPQGMPSILLAWNKCLDGDIDPRLTGFITVAEAIAHFMTAGLLLFEAFGMLAADDALSLKKGCITGRESGLPELGATSRSFCGAEAVPFPAMMGIVHDNLVRLTATSLGDDGVHWLFRFKRTNVGRHAVMCFPTEGYLRKFCIINRIAHSGDVDAWRLTGSEPRRGMAIWYHFGSTAGSIDALSRLVNQYDPDRTRAWLNGMLTERLGELHDEMLARHASAGASLSDEERSWREGARKALVDGRKRGADFEEVRREAIVATVLGVADGFETPGGLGGTVFREEVATLQALAGADVRIGARTNDPADERNALIKRARDYAKKNLLNPVPGGPAHCRCRTGRPQDSGASRMPADQGRPAGVLRRSRGATKIRTPSRTTPSAASYPACAAPTRSSSPATGPNSAAEVRRLEDAVELASSQSTEAEAPKAAGGRHDGGGCSGGGLPEARCLTARTPWMAGPPGWIRAGARIRLRVLRKGRAPGRLGCRGRLLRASEAARATRAAFRRWADAGLGLEAWSDSHLDADDGPFADLMLRRRAALDAIRTARKAHGSAGAQGRGRRSRHLGRRACAAGRHQPAWAGGRHSREALRWRRGRAVWRCVGRTQRSLPRWTCPWASRSCTGPMGGCANRRWRSSRGWRTRNRWAYRRCVRWPTRFGNGSPGWPSRGDRGRNPTTGCSAAGATHLRRAIRGSPSTPPTSSASSPWSSPCMRRSQRCSGRWPPALSCDGCVASPTEVPAAVGRRLTSKPAAGGIAWTHARYLVNDPKVPVVMDAAEVAVVLARLRAVPMGVGDAGARDRARGRQVDRRPPRHGRRGCAPPRSPAQPSTTSRRCCAGTASPCRRRPTPSVHPARRARRRRRRTEGDPGRT